MDIKMKKILLVLTSVLWFGVVGSIPVKAEEALQEMEITQQNQIMVAKEAVEAKETPDDSAATVISYESGAPVYVIGETSNGWYKVSYQDKVGYVHKSALVMSKLDVEGIGKEMESSEAESKLIVEEVERYRAEARRSRIWGIVIILLVAGIFATGIISTVKNEKKKREKDESNDGDEADSREDEMIKVKAERAAETEIDEEIIDLDKEE